MCVGHLKCLRISLVVLHNSEKCDRKHIHNLKSPSEEHLSLIFIFRCVLSSRIMHVVWNIIAEIMGMHILEQPTLQHRMYSSHMFSSLAQHNIYIFKTHQPANVHPLFKSSLTEIAVLITEQCQRERDRCVFICVIVRDCWIKHAGTAKRTSEHSSLSVSFYCLSNQGFQSCECVLCLYPIRLYIF